MITDVLLLTLPSPSTVKLVSAPSSAQRRRISMPDFVRITRPSLWGTLHHPRIKEFYLFIRRVLKVNIHIYIFLT